MTGKANSMEATFLDKDLIAHERVVSASPDYAEVLGTDTAVDATASIGAAYAEYRKNWVEYPRTQYVGAYPLHLDVECTNTCNLRCTMCQVPFKTMKPGFIDVAVLQKILGEMQGRGYRLPSIKFNFRGEPLAHPRIVDLVRIAKEAGVIEVQFNTNGTLLNDTLSRGLIEAGLVKIKFSVDGINPATYNAIRKGADYDKTVANILRFLEVRNSMGRLLPSVVVQMVYMPVNKAEAQQYLAFWKDKANRVGFSRYRDDHNDMGRAAQTPAAPRQRIPCPQLWQRLVVTWDGTVLMCCGDHQIKSPVGHLSKESIYDIWHGPRMQRVRQLHAEYRYDDVDACRECQVNYL